MQEKKMESDYGVNLSHWKDNGLMNLLIYVTIYICLMLCSRHKILGKSNTRAKMTEKKKKVANCSKHCFYQDTCLIFRDMPKVGHMIKELAESEILCTKDQLCS